MPYSDRLSIATAPRDGTLIRFWCRSEAEPVIGDWSRTFIGWVAYHEPIPLIRHDVTGWEPIARGPWVPMARTPWWWSGRRKRPPCVLPASNHPAERRGNEWLSIQPTHALWSVGAA
jgi:hypothetical protein